MKMELIEGSETSAISIVTPGNYPKENILNIVLTGYGLKLVVMRRRPHLHNVSYGRQLIARDPTSRYEGFTTVPS